MVSFWVSECVGTNGNNMTNRSTQMPSKQKSEVQDRAPPYVTPERKEEFERNLLRKISDIMQHWRN